MIDALADAGSATASDLAEAADVSKQHVRDTLERLTECMVAVSESVDVYTVVGEEWSLR